jgi:hypothetical protein
LKNLFTFSWTGSVLVYVMSESSKRHAQRAHARIVSRAAGTEPADVAPEVEGRPKP